jgi:hypothetical protein
MEPLKPEEKQRILAERPQAAPEDIDEYERLFAERFRRDPLLQAQPMFEMRLRNQDQRLQELHDKLFG